MKFDPNRIWAYLELDFADPKPIEHRLTEQQIIDTYYEYWAGQMQGKDASLINYENCVQDFVVVHWATRVTGE